MFLFATVTFLSFKTQLIITGAVVEKKRYNKKDDAWKAAVTTHKTTMREKNMHGSECCRLCQEKQPETKAWEKFVDYKYCHCFSFDDAFDPSEYEKENKFYSIGTCEESKSVQNSGELSKMHRHKNLIRDHNISSFGHF